LHQFLKLLVGYGRVVELHGSRHARELEQQLGCMDGKNYVQHTGSGRKENELPARQFSGFQWRW